MCVLPARDSNCRKYANAKGLADSSLCFLIQEVWNEYVSAGSKTMQPGVFTACQIDFRNRQSGEAHDKPFAANLVCFFLVTEKPEVVEIKG